MGRVLRVGLQVFTLLALGVIALLALARYKLDTARVTEALSVRVSAPGFGVDVAESSVTVPLEQAIAGIKGLESIRSTITAGQVVIDVRVTTVGVDSIDGMTLVREAVSRTQPQLPRELDPPILQRVRADAVTQHFVVQADQWSRLELSRWLDQVLVEKLQRQAGVLELNRCGAVTPELKIFLDAARLRAFGLTAQDVLNAIRPRENGIEALQNLPILGGKLRLNDVAQLELGSSPGSCLTAREVLVSVRMTPETRLTLPELPAAVKVTPLTPVRAMTFLSPPGQPVDGAMRALSRSYPGAFITAEGETLTALFVEAPQVVAVPGLALRSMDDRHAVVRVTGPDFEQLTALGTRVREALAKEQPRWLGTTWPTLGPEQVIKVAPGVREASVALQLAITGTVAGTLGDGTQIWVRAGTSIDDAVLPDGRPVREAVQISEELRPTALLRVNVERTVELEVGLEVKAVERVVKGLQLPAGYSVTVTEKIELSPSPCEAG